MVESENAPLSNNTSRRIDDLSLEAEIQKCFSSIQDAAFVKFVSKDEIQENFCKYCLRQAKEKINLIFSPQEISFGRIMLKFLLMVFCQLLAA